MIEKRPCGNSGLALSVLGLGCWSFGGGDGDYWGPQDERDVAEIVAQALDQGINYFDTAEGYNDGRSEESLGRALRRRRTEAIIGSKIGPANTKPATLRQHCEGSLRRLGTDYIDIYMVHWPITEHSVEDAFATLIDLQAEGKIRAIGVSNHGLQQMGRVRAAGASIAVNQLCYNLLSRGIEVEIMPYCAEHAIGILAYMPLQQGLLTGAYHSADELPAVRTRTRHFRSDRPGSRHGGPGAEAEVFAAIEGMRQIAQESRLSMTTLALAWCKARSEITSVLAGVRKPAQLAENVAAIQVELEPSIIAQLNALTEPILQKIGPAPDYFQSNANGRVR